MSECCVLTAEGYSKTKRLFLALLVFFYSSSFSWEMYFLQLSKKERKKTNHPCEQMGKMDLVNTGGNKEAMHKVLGGTRATCLIYT